MTAALVGMLVDEKKVDWDAPVTTYLPWFQLKDPAGDARADGARPARRTAPGSANADYLWYGQRASTDEILRRVRLIDPAYPVRSGFIYQNIMYAAAGAVIEAASGKSWADTIRARIFEPLGMRDTHRHRRDARRGSPTSPRRTRSSTAAVRVIENVSVDPVAPAEPSGRTSTTWRSGCSSC